MDFTIENCASVILLRPLTPVAKQWLTDHMPDDAQYFGDAVAIEPRYLEDVVDGLTNDGLTVG